MTSRKHRQEETHTETTEVEEPIQEDQEEALETTEDSEEAPEPQTSAEAQGRERRVVTDEETQETGTVEVEEDEDE